MVAPAADEVPAGVTVVVLVEGDSDKRAIEALAARRGDDLAAAGVAVVAMGGATNIGHFVRRYGPAGRDLRLAGLCDLGEQGHFRRALLAAGACGRGGEPDLAEVGFFVCDIDLEDELIRALGTDRIEPFIRAQGELGRFRTFQKQIAHRGRPLDAHVRRFVGIKAGRKARYAPAMVEAVEPARMPRPLTDLLDHVLG